MSQMNCYMGTYQRSQPKYEAGHCARHPEKLLPTLCYGYQIGVAEEGDADWHLHRHSNEGHRTTAGGNACLYARQRTVENRCSSSWNELDIVVVR